MLRQARPPGVHLPWRDEYRAGVYRDLRKDRAASVHAWEAHEGVPNIPFHGALISNCNDSIFPAPTLPDPTPFVVEDPIKVVAKRHNTIAPLLTTEQMDAISTTAN